MTYQVLARKWRPKQFQDVIGQEHVTKTLQNSVLKKQVGHAYLLTGTRGVGKTTIARILPRVLDVKIYRLMVILVWNAQLVNP